MEQGLGFAHFIAQSDGLGRFVLGALLVLSLSSWYLIVTKLITSFLTQRRADAFLSEFWRADSLQGVCSMLQGRPLDNAFARLAKEALQTADERHGLSRLAAAGGAGEFLTRVLRNGIDQEAARIEHGQTMLATAGSSSPYLGLLGTVWSIYHALVQIGLSGQGTLDKVAGPVGEALIMTALGLAVALPAVLAFNAFNRRNRVWLAQLDAFAHDLYAIITIGEKSNSSAGEVRALRVVAQRQEV